jgi:hypothetical protein
MTARRAETISFRCTAGLKAAATQVAREEGYATLSGWAASLIEREVVRALRSSARLGGGESEQAERAAIAVRRPPGEGAA